MISNEDIRELKSMARDWSDLSGDAGRDRQNPTMSRVEATVTAINSDGSLTVNMSSEDAPSLKTFKRTTACDDAKVGDRVIVDTLNHISYITGVLSTGNPHYVSQRITDFEANFSPYSDNQIPTVYKSGGMCVISGAVRNASAFTAGYSGVRMARLPEGFAPAQDYRTVCQGSSVYRYMLVVYKDGQVLCARYGNTTNVQAAADSWFVLSGAWAVG